MLTGNKALHTLDRSQKIIESAEDIAMMNADTSDPLDTADCGNVFAVCEGRGSRLSAAEVAELLSTRR
jgi:hypothetical protein